MAASDSDSTSSRAYFGRALTAFDEACERVGVITRHVAVARRVVQLRFAGPASVAVMMPALSHLTTDQQPPDLSVCVWDTASTGVTMPPPDWPLDSYAQRGEIRAFDDSGIRAAFSVDGPTLELWQEQSKRAMFWTREAASVPAHERAAPLRRTLGWWLSTQRIQIIHAAAVGVPGGCVLVGGAGGAGKSNTALACLGAGLTYLSDDYCGLSVGDTPLAHSLFSAAKVHPTDLDRLAFLRGLAEPPSRQGEDKLLFFLARHFREQLASACPVQAVVVPQLRPGGPTTLAPATAAQVARSLAVSTIAQMPYANTDTFRTVASLVRQRQAWHLYLGDDAVQRAPELIRELAGREVGAACA